MLLLSLLIALALGSAGTGQAPAPSMPPPRGDRQFDAPAYWGVGIGALVTAEKPEREVRADFPPASGVVIFEARINELGKVTSACVVRSVRPDMDAAARASLMRSKFRPARFRNPPRTPVPVVQTVAVKVFGRDR